MAQDWLRKFERALSQPTVADMDSLFNSDCHWRDVLALNWEIITHSGSTAVPQALIHAARHHGPHDFKVNQQRMPAQWVKRTDVDTIEVHFTKNWGGDDGRQAAGWFDEKQVQFTGPKTIRSATLQGKE